MDERNQCDEKNGSAVTEGGDATALADGKDKTVVEGVILEGEPVAKGYGVRALVRALVRNVELDEDSGWIWKLKQQMKALMYGESVAQGEAATKGLEESPKEDVIVKHGPEAGKSGYCRGKFSLKLKLVDLLKVAVKHSKKLK